MRKPTIPAILLMIGLAGCDNTPEPTDTPAQDATGYGTEDLVEPPAGATQPVEGRDPSPSGGTGGGIPGHNPGATE